MKPLLNAILTALLTLSLPTVALCDNFTYAFGNIAFNGLDSENLPFGNVKKVAAGTDHSLILKSDGTLWSAGGNLHGQLGDGSVNPRSYPQQIASDVVDIAAGHYTSLWVKSDGSLWTCGANANQQIGAPQATGVWTPQPIDTNVSAVFAGHSHNLYVKTDDTLYTLGLSAQPTLLASDVKTAAAGKFHTLFVKNDNTLWGIGYDEANVRIVTNIIQNNTPKLLAAQVTQVAAGDEHSLILKEDGSLWGEGLNHSGELGTGSTNSILLYQKIADNVSNFSAYKNSSAYIDTNGTAYKIGNPTSNTQSSANILTPQSFAENQASLDLGGAHVLLVNKTAELSARGSNDSGQLAAESIPPPGSFTLIGENLQTVSLGNGHALVVDAEGNLWGAGANEFGALGDGSAIDRTSFVLIDTDVSQASAGNTYSLYLKNDKTLWGMGANWYNNLSSAAQNPQLTPLQIATDVTAFVAEFERSYFVTSDKTLWGLGANILGRNYLGNGTDSPTATQILEDVVDVDASLKLTLFLQSDGTVWGTGLDRFRYGISNQSQQGNLYPVFADATAVSAGSIHVLYLKENGELWGAGANDYGQLGLGHGSSSVPVLIAENVVAAEARESATLYLKSNGTLWGLGAGVADLRNPNNSNPARSPILIATHVRSFSGGGGSLLVQSSASHLTDEDLDGILALFDPNDTNPHNPLVDENNDYVPDTYTQSYPVFDYSPQITKIWTTKDNRLVQSPVSPGYLYYLETSQNLTSWTPVSDDEFPPFTVSEPSLYHEITLPQTPAFYRLASKLR